MRYLRWVGPHPLVGDTVDNLGLFYRVDVVLKHGVMATPIPSVKRPTWYRLAVVGKVVRAYE